MNTRLALTNLKQTKSKPTRAEIPLDENIVRQTNYHKAHRYVTKGMFKGVIDTRSDKCIFLSCRSNTMSNCQFCKLVPYVSSSLRREYNYSILTLAPCLPIPSHSKDFSNRSKNNLDDRKEKARTLFESQVQKLSRSPTLSRAKEQLNRLSVRVREASSGVLERSINGQQQIW